MIIKMLKMCNNDNDVVIQTTSRFVREIFEFINEVQDHRRERD